LVSCFQYSRYFSKPLSNNISTKRIFYLKKQIETLKLKPELYVFYIISKNIMHYQGIVKFIWQKESIAEGVEKQTIVLEENTDREFKGSLAVDFFRDKIQLLENVKVGDLVTAHLNTRSNESKNQPGRYFNSVTCWRIETGNQWTPAQSSNDDLPF
jgi:hypothetical protein